MAKIKQHPAGSLVNVPEDKGSQTPTGAPRQEKLTTVTNRDGEKDVYGNATFKPGRWDDELAINSPRDPAGYENPEAGSFFQDGNIYCDDCGGPVTPEEMALARHIGHATRYAGKKNFDIAQVVRGGPDSSGLRPSDPAEGTTGPDSYRVGWETRRSDLAWAPEPIEEGPGVLPGIRDDSTGSGPLTAGPDTLTDQVVDRTVPM